MNQVSLENLKIGYVMQREEVVVPEWIEYFMGISEEISKRSPDAQTKVGAVIVTQSNEMVTTGYNGFVRGIDASSLPNLRPGKYDWMIHAERNAILSAARQGKSIVGCKAYSTYRPCLQCSQDLWQAGITEVYYPASSVCNKGQKPEEEAKIELFYSLIGDKMKFIGV
jgi:dCMP deaminase